MASYINILTLTTKTSCAVNSAMRLCCQYLPLLLCERSVASAVLIGRISPDDRFLRTKTLTRGRHVA
jgi:hypothetical protein